MVDILIEIEEKTNHSYLLSGKINCDFSGLIYLYVFFMFYQRNVTSVQVYQVIKREGGGIYVREWIRNKLIFYNG